ncbi:uncharacterized protein LODBEIA_P26280 [Lodderomyces beijingensis]|uniref:MRH domain-containing protein n=1 Tax=Lodderomyces beijingensis TaxID=1775926 RepID=A0ABP0ZKK0_9ASCO
MIKFLRRVLIPTILVALIILLTFLRTKPVVDNSLYLQSTQQIFDSLSHFSFSLPIASSNNNDNDNHVDGSKQPTAPYQNQNQAHLPDGTQDSLESKTKPLDPCTVVNPLNKMFIDLSGLSSFGNDNKPMSWNAKGYDSGKNYTIGICSNPFKKHHDESSEIQDRLNSSKIGAYYIDSETNKYVSIGEYSTVPKFRGRKLTLTYENGSYCNAYDSKTGERLRKSTVLTFTCDREMSAKASAYYIDSSNDCTYFFEIRSHQACPTAPPTNNSAAVWIFLFILLAALFVYFSGGLLYRHMKSIKSPITSTHHHHHHHHNQQQHHTHINTSQLKV